MSINIRFYRVIMVCLAYALSSPTKVFSGEPITIDPLSVTSLLLELKAGKDTLGYGTGFVVESQGKRYLMSNHHVFSGVDPSNNKPIRNDGKVPDSMRIWYHTQKLSNWVGPIVNLHAKDGSAKWLRPKNPKIDVAAFPIDSVTDDIKIYPFDLKLADTDMRVTVGMTAFVIGFPDGLSATGHSTIAQGQKKMGVKMTGMPIWKAGHIATDPDIDYDGYPAMLIDATTRGGMSGSPVVVRVTGMVTTKKGDNVLSIGGNPRDVFLGMYSAQFKELELGYVWKPRVIFDLLAGK